MFKEKVKSVTKIIMKALPLIQGVPEKMTVYKKAIQDIKGHFF